MSQFQGQIDIIDFHNHFMPPRLQQAVVENAPPSQRARWEGLAKKLTDEDLLMKDIRDGQIGARVVNFPIEFLSGETRPTHETVTGMNDDLAELVGRHPGQIHGLGSVDAFEGDKSGREAERAIRDLGLRGLFVECARGDLMLDAPEARPTLEVAARYGVPVFAHPIAPQPFSRQMAPYGAVGTVFARGTINSASLISLIEGGVFSELPGLRIVVTALAFGGIAMAASLSGRSLLPSGTIEVMRKHIFIDTICIQPALLRAAVDILGADNALVGSDWPINDKPLRPLLSEAMRQAGLSEVEQKAVAAGNCRRLLGLG